MQARVNIDRLIGVLDFPVSPSDDEALQCDLNFALCRSGVLEGVLEFW